MDHALKFPVSQTSIAARFLDKDALGSRYDHRETPRNEECQFSSDESRNPDILGISDGFRSVMRDGLGTLADGWAIHTLTRRGKLPIG
jgi:hypothetical protein